MATFEGLAGLQPIPQNKISICTSFSRGSRRWMLETASGEVALEAAYASALYIGITFRVSRWSLNAPTFAIEGKRRNS